MLLESNNLLIANDLGRMHPGRPQWLLEGVSLEVAAGDRLAIAGPSGAGKTVLLRLLALLDPPDRGTVRWQGRRVCRDRTPGFRSHVIYVHQRPALLEGVVEEALRLPFSLAVHRGRHFDRPVILHRLLALGRDETFLAKSVRELSGGEMQIVALLRAIQLDPAVLLLDEPTAALDAEAAVSIEGLVERWLAEEPGHRALVWVSHDAPQVQRVARRVLWLEAGRMTAGPNAAAEDKTHG